MSVSRGMWSAGRRRFGRSNASRAQEPEKSVDLPSDRRNVTREQSCIVDWVSETPGAQGSILSAHLQCSGPPEGAGMLSRSD